MSSASDRGSPEAQRSAPARFVARYPIAAFLIGAFGIGWPVLAIPAVSELPTEPSLLVLTFIGLLGSSLIVTRVTSGQGAIGRLLSRLLIWRFSPGRWAVILLGMPALTLALGAVSGDLQTPEIGWAGLVGTYLYETFTILLLINLWEETAWAGFVQSRLMERRGLLIGALLTALPFAAIHVPLQFTPGWTWSEVGFGVAVVFAAAPFYRLLIGMHLLDTGGSLLAVAIQHAAWNASGKLGAGDLWPVAAAILLTILVALARLGGKRRKR